MRRREHHAVPRLNDEITTPRRPHQDEEDDTIYFEGKQLLFWTFVSSMLLLLGALIMYLAIHMSEVNKFTENVHNLKMDLVLLFHKYDRNDDGKIDILEFEPLAYTLLKAQEEYVNDLKIEDDDEVVTLNAYFEPIVLQSMTKISSPDLLENPESLKFLKSWREPFIEKKNFASRHFASLIPKDFDTLPLGQVWDLIPRSKSRGREFDQLSNNRYNPSKPAEHELILFRVLQMFHKRPFIHSRFHPQGTSLTLRARNKDFIDIVFRTHAEFQLNEPPYHPFWFTPAQFNGRLIISKNSSHIVYFQLYLPSLKKLNIDMEWINEINPDREAESMEVDIGYVPRMEIVSSMPSKKSSKFISAQSDDGTVINVTASSANSYHKPLSSNAYNSLLQHGIIWDEEIELEKTLEALEKAFFPFKEVPYYSFAEIFEKAKKLNKLVHFILLWGSLDDQSC